MKVRILLSVPEVLVVRTVMTYAVEMETDKTPEQLVAEYAANPHEGYGKYMNLEVWDGDIYGQDDYDTETTEVSSGDSYIKVEVIEERGAA